MIKRLVLALAASVLTLWVWTAPSAQATFTACDGVWVVVDYGSLGGVKTACATNFSTGTAALRSAGFAPTLDSGFLTKINGLPASPDPNTAYWSYWQATRNTDGGYDGWKYSNLGANSSHPTKGNAEGWHYIGAAGSASAPGATPPKNPEASSPTAKPSASPKPTSTPTKKPTTTATPSAKPTAAASTPNSASAKPTTTTPRSASPTPSAPSSPAPPTPSSANSSAPSSAETGSPVAAITTVSVIAIGGVGAGGWWLWKGRRP